MAPPLSYSRHSVAAYYSIYRPRRDERLSWPGWLTYSGRFTHICGHPSATCRARDRESYPDRDRRSIAVPRNQQQRVIAAYCYTQSSMVRLPVCGCVCLSVCLSIGHVCEPCENGWSDLDAFWERGLAESDGPKEPSIRWECIFPQRGRAFCGVSPGTW